MKAIIDILNANKTPEQTVPAGLFAGALDISSRGYYENPVLVASADGVGSKRLIALSTDHLFVIGGDVVRNNINDVLCLGAKPLFFLDYISIAPGYSNVIQMLVKGMQQECVDHNLAFLGGETEFVAMDTIHAASRRPLSSPDFDLSGTVVGIVERGREITGARIEIGDIVVGLESSGLHTNGYNAARRALTRRMGVRDWWANDLDSLMLPHKNYWPTLRPHLSSEIHGIAHITGGGYSNIARIIPDGMCANLTMDWNVPEIFNTIQLAGVYDLKYMLSEFNMGIGMVVVCSAEKANALLRSKHDCARVIGTIGRNENQSKVSIVRSETVTRTETFEL